MWRVAKILLIVLLPLLWGLGSDFFFALIRKKDDDAGAPSGAGG